MFDKIVSGLFALLVFAGFIILILKKAGVWDKIIASLKEKGVNIPEKPKLPFKKPRGNMLVSTKW